MATQIQTLCGRCAASGKTCCQETDIYLTVGDIKRIACEIERIDFFEYRRPTDHLYLEQEDDPVWGAQTISINGTRRVLKQKDAGDCLFLGERGCSLSAAARPLVCRLHPFTYTMEGLAGILDPRCLTANGSAGGDLVAALGMSLSQAQAWHLQLYEEIFLNEDTAYHEDRHHLRPAV